MEQQTTARPRSPISGVQRRKLTELYRGLHGCTEIDALRGLDALFMREYKHPLDQGSYEEGAHLTAALLAQNRIAERPQAATPPANYVSNMVEEAKRQAKATPAPVPASTAVPAEPVTPPAPSTQPTPVPAPQSELQSLEAPYAGNVYVETPGGYVWQFTLRALTGDIEGKEFIDRALAMEKYLSARGCKPAARRGGGASSSEAPLAEGETAPICPYHKAPMEKRQGKNGSFWSCHHKIEGTDQWCQYKPPK